MTRLDFTAINSALYSRATGDATLVAAVGSIFPAEGLKNLSGKTLPYLVWRDLGGSGESGQMVNINAGWWAYVAPGEVNGVRKLTDIATLVYALYSGENRQALSGGDLHAITPRQIFFDESLGLRGIHIPIYLRKLG